MTATLQTARPDPPSPAAGGQSLLRRLPLRELGMLPAIALAMAVGAAVSPVFLTSGNLINVLQQSSELSIVVVAEVLILISGKFDLSLESIVGFTAMLAAWLVVPEAAGGLGVELPGLLGLVVLFSLGATLGLFNGLLVVKFRLNAFIATLAVLILLRGATLGVVNGRTLSDLPPEFTYLSDHGVLGVPLSVWLAGTLFLIAGVFLRNHRQGRSLYVIGGNADAARAAGIRVDRVLIAVYVTAGMLASLAGLLFMGRLAAVTANQGQNMIFTVFAAAVIGGISLNGGRGTMLGAFTGVLLLGLISNILTLSQISSFWIQASQGGIILGALLFQRFTAGEVAVE